MFVFCPPRELPEIKAETFPDGRYYTTPSGERYPSVTTVIGAKQKKEIIEWRSRVGPQEANRVSKIASGRGNRFHSLCEQYLSNEQLKPTMPDAMALFNKFKPVLHNIDNIHYLEAGLWSSRLEMAGRVDCIAEWKGKLSVVDFKTSKRLKTEEDIPDYFAQCTAYACMYEEIIGDPIDQIVVAIAIEDGPPLVYVKNTQDYVMSLGRYIRYYRHFILRKGLTGT